MEEPAYVGEFPEVTGLSEQVKQYLRDGKTKHTRFSSLKPPHLVCTDASQCTNVHLAPQFYKKIVNIKML